MPNRPLSLVTPRRPPADARGVVPPATGDLLSYAADALATGVLLFDANAAIVAANVAARTLLRSASIDTADTARLRLQDAALQSRIETSIRALARVAADVDGDGSPGAAGAVTAFGLGDAGGGRPRLSLRLSPVGAARGPAPRVARMPTVLGQLVDHGRASSPDPRLLNDLFDLGDASARVAVACLRADSVKEVARLLGISANTVKTHLLSVYGKTGCTRRSQLVRLLSTLDEPRVQPMAAPRR